MQRARLILGGLMLIAVTSQAAICGGLPLALGLWSAALLFLSWLPLELLLIWMLWRGSLVAKWLLVAMFGVHALWTGSAAVYLGIEPPANDPTGGVLSDGIVYGLVGWALFSVAAALILMLSPSVQVYLNDQAAFYKQARERLEPRPQFKLPFLPTVLFGTAFGVSALVSFGLVLVCEVCLHYDWHDGVHAVLIVLGMWGAVAPFLLSLAALNVIRHLWREIARLERR